MIHQDLEKYAEQKPMLGQTSLSYIKFGTCMFLWGLSIIVQILGWDDELEFKEFVP